MVAEQVDRDGELVTDYGIRTSRYATPFTCRGLGMIGQPVPQYYFHRPLGALLAPAFAAGFVMDALEEPTFGPDTEGGRLFSWANLTDIPPALIVRLRLA